MQQTQLKKMILNIMLVDDTINNINSLANIIYKLEDQYIIKI